MNKRALSAKQNIVGLEAKVKAFRTDQEFTEFATTMSRFYVHSFRN